MYPFRVFLSYAHADRQQLERVDVVLRDVGLVPVWDREIGGGESFDDGIRRWIAQAHLFMPLLTPNSCSRPWVHQEIGYALGIGVPVVPIARGALPEGMLSGTQAIRVEDDLSDLREQVERAEIESLVVSRHAEGELERLGITTHLAELREERTRLLVKSAKEVRELARVRQRAIFSSFSLPDAAPDDPIWKEIELPERRGELLRRLLRDERQTLEGHARAAGCSLILSPMVDFSSVGVAVHRAQLKTLRDFLTSMPPSSCHVAVVERGFAGNLTVVGDWFGVKALPPRPGAEYRQSVFSHHAPSILRWVRDFDHELERRLQASKIGWNDSRDHAVRKIDERLGQLPKH